MKREKQLYLAGGCFWGTEKYFSLIHGVLETRVGYANGHTPNPTYEQVCAGDTGHAETVYIRYDSGILGLTRLLDYYYDVVDPTSVNRQGGDAGTQYRTGIFYTDEADRDIILGSIQLLQESLAAPVAIAVEKLTGFYDAEQYHQKYLDKNPAGYCHIAADKFEMAEQSSTGANPGKEGDDALRERLTPIQYEVARLGATEPPFKNDYWDKFEQGIYVDIVSGQPLFVSADKFESGCGWPSFSRPIDGELLAELPDHSYGRDRTEVRAAGSDIHLGHVFDDGPAESGGLRYCINSASLRFVSKDRMEAEGYGRFLALLSCD